MQRRHFNAIPGLGTTVRGGFADVFILGGSRRVKATVQRCIGSVRRRTLLQTSGGLRHPDLGPNVSDFCFSVPERTQALDHDVVLSHENFLRHRLPEEDRR